MLTLRLQRIVLMMKIMNGAVFNLNNVVKRH